LIEVTVVLSGRNEEALEHVETFEDSLQKVASVDRKLLARAVAPEAQVGGVIGLLQDGDVITINSHKKELSVDLSSQDIEKRRSAWTAPEPRYTRGALYKFAQLVSSASQGAYTS